MKFASQFLSFVTLFTATTVSALVSSGSAAENTVDFAREVQPVFARRCYKCHGSGGEEGGLQLHQRELALTELDSGDRAIVAGKPDESVILDRITSTDEYERMPPDGKPLTEEETAAIRQWIKEGAKWGKHWAFAEVKQPTPPQVKKPAWVQNPIDAFVLHRLEANGLQPAPKADKIALIRRAYYDITGLPPTPGEVDAFVADDSPGAWEKVIDRLLKSPAYGEKWARHWLDLVRYAETNGYERDNPKDNVWKYRDYVIGAFNKDKPYDQFVKEQLAGDEFEKPTKESITATGFYRLGLWDDEPVDRKQAFYDGLDDIVVTSSQAFLGLTVGCARCHDHKLDPIPQTDYYSMLAFFHNLKHGNTQVEVAPEEERRKYAERMRQHGEQLKQLRDTIARLERKVFDALSNPEKEDAKDRRTRNRLILQRRGKVLSKAELKELIAAKQEERQLSSTRMPQVEQALAAQENGERAPETFVLARGNAHAPGEKVEPGFPAIISPGKPSLPEQGRNGATLRRTVLANWVVSPDNPMTSRVMVNRIWQFHFGRGIVRSASDFGYQGTPPTHPLLLDWLAAEFVDRGWSMKQMHKLMMMSSTYQMSTQTSQAALEKDPENELFWRFNMRRLTAEEIRDSILTASGAINLAMFGPQVYPPLPQEVLATASRPGAGWRTSPAEQATRRSIYVHVKRSLRHPMLVGFDSPDADTTCAVRVTTTVPTQALSMLNSKFMNDQAATMATRLEKELPGDLKKQVARAIRLTTSRTPSEADIARDLEFIKSIQEEEKLSQQEALKNYCLVLLNTNEFVYLQ